MTGVIAYTLPAMQLVCHLVVSGPSSTNITESVPYTTLQSPPQNKISTPLPDGYVANLDLGFAYKYHKRRLTWIRARNVCVQEGAQLAVIDSPEKMEYIGNLASNHVHAGIFRIHDDTWINVNTGEPVSSLGWSPFEPRDGLDCAEFFSSAAGTGLDSFKYNDEEEFFCEIPILVHSTITRN